MGITYGSGKYSSILILHGGAGPQDPNPSKLADAVLSLDKIATSTLGKDLSGIDTVEHCLREMENDTRFNAGLGSALQSDGKARLSASLMDGHRQSFSGVISAQDLKNPSILAKTLQQKESRVLTNPGIETLAKELNLSFQNITTPERRQHWLERKSNLEQESNGSDTVGCVLLNNHKLYAGSSTGGRGFENPGRVSDSATVAGNYASEFAAVTATGIGEQIVDDALSVRIESRVRDGMKLREASEKCYQEAQARDRAYGWIAVSAEGEWSIAHTTPSMPFVLFCDGKKIEP